MSFNPKGNNFRIHFPLTHTHLPSQNAWLKLNSIQTDLMYHCDQSTFHNLAKQTNQTSAPVNDAHRCHNSHKNLHMFGYESVRKYMVLIGECGVVSPVGAAPLLAWLYKANNLDEEITMIALQPVFSNETVYVVVLVLLFG